MAKVNIKSEKITPFGGIYYASKAFYALSLDKVINGTLGVRSSTYNGYQWNEIMSAMSDVFLCGSDCVEDVNRSECHLRESPEIRIPTSHTIGRAIKELSHEDMEYKSSSGNVFRFNTNPRLNDLLMKLNMKMELFKSGQTVNVDFDHVFVKTEKADAKYSYKQAYGYFPGIVSIDGIIAYIENRDGNCRIFYIRAIHSASMYSRIQDIREWRRVEIGSQETEVASVMSTQFMEDSRYRIVVQRTKEKDSTPDLFGDRYTYRCIITNDWDSEEKSVIETYNKRGARESDFDRLNNDFGWKHLPCSFLNENTVYMILTAFCMNFFSYFIRAVSSVFTSLSPTSRVKKFVFHFTAVCASSFRRKAIFEHRLNLVRHQFTDMSTHKCTIFLRIPLLFHKSCVVFFLILHICFKPIKGNFNCWSSFSG